MAGSIVGIPKHFLMSIEDVFTITGVAFVMSVIATIYPAWRASRTQPAEALRYE